MLLEYDADDWSHWIGIMNAMGKITVPAADAGAREEAGATLTFDEARAEVAELAKTLKTVAKPPSTILAESVDAKKKANTGKDVDADAANEGGNNLRGPRLAEIELTWRTLAKKASDGEGEGDVASDFLKLILQYLEKFGSKLCCFSDIRKYLNECRSHTTAKAASVFGSLSENLEGMMQTEKMLAQEGMSKLAAGGNGESDSSSSPSVAELQKTLRRYICAAQCLHVIGGGAHAISAPVTENSPPSTIRKDVRASVRELLEMYQSTLPLNESAEGGQREVQVGDDLILLAVHLLIDLGTHLSLTSASACVTENVGGKGSFEVTALIQQQSTMCQWLIEGSLLLEILLNNSPYNYQAQMLLSKLYVELGALKPAVKHHNKLGIKQIQTDSLSWMMMSDILRLGGFDEGLEMCNGVLSFHNTHKRDVPEWVQNALVCKNLVQAREIWTFDQKRMVRSHQLAVARAEMLNLIMLDEGSIDELKKSLEKVLFMDGRPSSHHLRNATGLDQCCLTQASFDELFWNYDFEVMNHWQPQRDTDDTISTDEEKRKQRIKPVAGPSAHGLCSGFSSFTVAAVGEDNALSSTGVRSMMPCSTPFANAASALLPKTSFEWLKVHASVPRFFLWSMQGQPGNCKDHFERMHVALKALSFVPDGYSPAMDADEDESARIGRVQKLVEEEAVASGVGVAFWVVIVEVFAALLACLAAAEADKKGAKSASASHWTEAASRLAMVAKLIPLGKQQVDASKFLFANDNEAALQPEMTETARTEGFDISPFFVTQLSSVVLHQLQWTTKTLSIISSAALPKAKRKGGGKGGKGGKKKQESASPVENGPVDVARTQFSAALEALFGCMDEFKAHTKSPLAPTKVASSGGDAAPSLTLPYDADVFAKNSTDISSDRVITEIRESHRFSLERIQEAIKKQLDMLRPLRA
jgi:hypothetical protein